jgi:hypothetical protein
MQATLMTRRSVDYHERILACLAKCNIDAARRETEEHFLVNKDAAARLYGKGSGETKQSTTKRARRRRRSKTRVSDEE